MFLDNDCFTSSCELLESQARMSDLAGFEMQLRRKEGDKQDSLSRVAVISPAER